MVVGSGATSSDETRRGGLGATAVKRLPRTPRKSLADLLADTPKMVGDLLKAEIDHLKQELSGHVKGVAKSGVLLAIAAVLALFLFGWLLHAGFEGLNLVFAPWLSALLVAAFLLLLLLAFGIPGFLALKKHTDFSDIETVDSIKDDINMVRGLGYAGEGSDPLDDIDASARRRVRASGSGSTAIGDQR